MQLIPGKEHAKYIDSDHGSLMALQNFNEETFALIFLSILLENSIVFVSSNLAVLSSTLLIFHSLLKPFKWPHPLIFNVPQNLLNILDSPFPVLVGINQDAQFIYENELDQKHPQCIFFLLDEISGVPFDTNLFNK
jgi:hypothetical protein